jgi:hypothetical protein
MRQRTCIAIGLSIATHLTLIATLPLEAKAPLPNTNTNTKQHFITPVTISVEFVPPKANLENTTKSHTTSESSSRDSLVASSRAKKGSKHKNLPTSKEPGLSGSLLSMRVADSALTHTASTMDLRPDFANVLAGSGGHNDLSTTNVDQVTTWRHHGDGSQSAKGRPFRARIMDDGRIVFQDNDPVRARLVRWRGIPMPLIVGEFDLTEAAMQAKGDTLYPYQKHKLMEETRAQREVLAKEARSKNLMESRLGFREYLENLWNDKSIPLPERKRLLFALWDECATKGSKEVVATALSIRAIITNFVQTRLPTSSPHAYTASELEVLNDSRKSKQKFEPY